MLVQDWMSKNVVKVDAGDSMQHAVKLMLEHRISMLPVFEDDKLVGIVTDRDLKRAGPSDVTLLEIKHILYHLSRVEIRTIMSSYPITVPPDFTLEETAETLLKNRISGCPVVDDQGKMVGVITRSDLFKAVISLTGLSHRGIQFGFLLEDRPGSIKEVTDIIRRYGGRLVSIMSTYDGAPENHRFAYVRAFNMDRVALPSLQKELREKAVVLYMVDLRENKREIY